ncbi:MAG: hypothetical protein JO019_02235 [Candidatus Kaiserbacteria bacterium]|nr:hypothetical protein [Candidatus Kaiserbacteria bacterium]
MNHTLGKFAITATVGMHGMADEIGIVIAEFVSHSAAEVWSHGMRIARELRPQLEIRDAHIVPLPDAQTLKMARIIDPHLHSGCPASVVKTLLRLVKEANNGAPHPALAAA